MSNIDWFGVFYNALWIFGLAIALATISYADWRRHLCQPPLRLRQALAQPAFQAAWCLGLLFFCAGLALSGGPWWQSAAWAALAIAFLYLSGSALLRARRGVS